MGVVVFCSLLLPYICQIREHPHLPFPTFVVILLYQIGSILAFSKVDRAIKEFSVAEGSCLLRARRHHHGLVPGGATIHFDAREHDLIITTLICSLSRVSQAASRAVPHVLLLLMAVPEALARVRVILL